MATPIDDLLASEADLRRHFNQLPEPQQQAFLAGLRAARQMINLMVNLIDDDEPAEMVREVDEGQGQ